MAIRLLFIRIHFHWSHSRRLTLNFRDDRSYVGNHKAIMNRTNKWAYFAYSSFLKKEFSNQFFPSYFGRILCDLQHVRVLYIKFLHLNRIHNRSFFWLHMALLVVCVKLKLVSKVYSFVRSNLSHCYISWNVVIATLNWWAEFVRRKSYFPSKILFIFNNFVPE